MKNRNPEYGKNRRAFLKGSVAAGAAVAGATVLSGRKAFAKSSESLTKGDVAILRLLAAVELIEADLWQQYAELGGVTQGTQNPYQLALQTLDSNGSQYLSSNTLDELSHADFLNAYLISKGEEPVNLDRFRTLPSSAAAGAQQIGRLTNLMQLTVDTSWYTRYRSQTNPDFGATFPQALPALFDNPHTAIPRTNAELNGNAVHVQAIANTAGFHFGFIEQAGTSLYATLSQKVSSPEVLMITLGIGGAEIMHFQVWHDKAGNAVALTDNQPGGTLTFVNLAQGQPESLQANLIMPEPTDFIKGLPEVSIIRPTGAGQLDATGAIKGFIEDGLFIGQPNELQQFLLNLAAEADAARRES